MHDFLNMGDYGVYVWSSYGLTIAVLLANVLESYWRLRRVARQIRLQNAAGGDRS